MRTRRIDPAWIERTLSRPDRKESDEIDPTLEHRLAVISEMDHRVLRVVCRPGRDPIQVVTAYFDRGLRGKL